LLYANGKMRVKGMTWLEDWKWCGSSCGCW